MKFKSDVSGNEFSTKEQVQAKLLRQPIYDMIKNDHPAFDETCSLSISEVNRYRQQYISDFMAKDLGEISDLESKVLEALKENSIVSDNPDEDDKGSTMGQRVADKVATFGGSWTFILSFLAFLLLWIAANAFILMNKGFDPYPFILLNLILSCLAALQAPVIMMSQNRQEEKDRERARNDYMVNLKSELEIRLLHEKLDHLILHQEQSLIEIQRVQIDMMNDILSRMEKK
jgi:uncharacterized membrane protein